MKSYFLKPALLVLVVGLNACAFAKFQPENPGILQGGGQVVIPALDSGVEEADLIWPLKEGKISSAFGKRKRDFHDGIDIKANRGTPVYAAQDGRVVYSSRKIRGYGNMIVVRHEGDFATVYAHHQKNLVRYGQAVKKGQLIAYVGATGKATGPHLHFEVRKNRMPVDPIQYLPPINFNQVVIQKSQSSSNRHL